jgi:hypothetical protein
MIKKIILITLFIFSNNVNATTYFISTTGSDSHTGNSESQAWATFSHAIAAINAGDILVILSGTYNQSIVISKSGSYGSVITIGSQTDGAAIIDGQNTRQPLSISGNYITFEGTVFKNSAGNVVDIEGNHNILRRCSAYNADTNGNNHRFCITGDYNLLEDCAAGGTGRYCYLNYNCQNNTLRRCFGKWGSHSAGSPRAVFCNYGAENILMENCIGLDVYPHINTTLEYYGVYQTWADYNDHPTNNCRYYGCVFYNNLQGGVICANTSGPHTEFVDCVIFDHDLTDSFGAHSSDECGYGIASASQTQMIVRNCTFVNNSNTALMYQGSEPITNCLFVQNGYAISGTTTHQYCDFWQNTTNGTSIGATDKQVDPEFKFGSYINIPDDSPLKGAGLDGKDIGANVSYRYEDGVLTDELLWPWPMQARILAELDYSVIDSLSYPSISQQPFDRFNPPYPRVFTFDFGVAPPSWYAKFDVAVCDQDFAKIKAINPNTICLKRRDWNVWETDGTCPAEWFLRGTTMRLRNGEAHYDSVEAYNGEAYINISDYCPTAIKGSGNWRYNDYMTDYVLDLVDNPNVDGFMSQGVYDCPRVSDFDMDNNHVNDGSSWGKTNWLAGINTTVTPLYEQMSADGKVLILNSGGLYMPIEWDQSNGAMDEHTHLPETDPAWNRSTMQEWMATAPEPHFLLEDCESEYKDDFREMRYMLTETLLGDGFFSFCEKRGDFNEHWFKRYYDEYDLNLGYPTSDAEELDNGCWVRFFDNGVSIVNTTGDYKTVTDANLQTSSYYHGKYHRFEGGQDPDMNDGTEFSTITLFGDDAGGTTGDGIILVREAQTVISDIVIDNCDAATSPGSVTATFTGTWVHDDEMGTCKDCSGGDDFYRMAYRGGTNGVYDYSYTQKGYGQNTATYKPTISVAGYYEVSEWHGWEGEKDGVNTPSGFTESTNTPYTLTYSGSATTSGTINQSINYGQWNSLGTYYFDKGTTGKIVINNNANGEVIADAFQWVFKGKEIDLVLPNSPRSLTLASRTEHTINLSWTQPLAASDGDIASSYKIYRDGNLVGNSVSTSYSSTGLLENQTYSYSVYAVDNVGNVSSSSATGSFATLQDATAPTIISVQATNPTHVKIVFSEPLESASATNKNNYTINNSITVSTATLDNSKEVVLLTNNHVIGTTYTLIVSNVRDIASMPNTIGTNTNNYVGVGDSIRIAISADNDYELFVNGDSVGAETGDEWETAELYSVPSIAGDNIIAVKGIDVGGPGGLVAEVEFNGEHFVTNTTSWRVSTTEQTGWKELTFDDAAWDNATSIGLHGEGLPWSLYRNVDGISTSSGVEWIWSSDNEDDNTVYFRFIPGVDNPLPPDEPPKPPTNMIITVDN